MNKIEFTKYTKTYATEANLTKAIAKNGFANYRHIVVRTPEGQWTAIFLWHHNCGWMVIDTASKGFVTVA